MKKLAAAVAAFLTLGGMQAPAIDTRPAAPLSLWRLDCGELVINDFNAYFSDTYAYTPGQRKNLVASCYLIRNGDRYMLWDTGLEAKLIGSPARSPEETMSLSQTIVSQLKQLGVKPEQIEIIGISHYHSDHIGQAANFPKARLIIGKEDMQVLRRGGPYLEPNLLKPWIGGGKNVVEASSDVDVFDDGRVVMLRMPGHTPGHSALLVRLASGPVLLTGDLYHFQEQVLIKGVPPFNTDRADTLASMDRFDRMARNLKARVIIQHEPADVAKLPAFPRAAE